MKPWLPLAAVLILAGCDNKPELVLGWAPVEPAAEISKTLQSVLDPKFRLQARQVSDSRALLRALEEGSVDLAIIEQPELPIPGLSLLLPVFPSVLHVLVPDETGPEVTLADLAVSGPVYAGPPGGAGFRLVVSLSRRGVLPPLEEIQLLESPLGNTPEVYLIFGGLLSDDALSRLPEHRLFSLGKVEQLGQGAWVEGVALRYLHLDPFVLPRGLYRQLSDEPVVTLAVTSLLVSRSDMSAETAYEVSRLVKHNLASIEAIYPLARKTILGPIVDGMNNVPLHPGSRRYLDRDAPSFGERYAELMALLVTLVIAASSAAVALLRMRRQAKKDRIDVYLDEVLKLRSSMRNGELAPQQAAADLSALQATVTRLVVDERIIADASFVGFLTLSNQVLNEAAGTPRQSAVSATSGLQT